LRTISRRRPRALAAGQLKRHSRTLASLGPVFGNVPRQSVSQPADVAYRGIVESLRPIAVVVVRIVRGWFGLTYLADIEPSYRGPFRGLPKLWTGE
jgi:hypothetical protein